MAQSLFLVRPIPKGQRMTQEKAAQAHDAKSEKPGGTGRKERLAAALRRNLAKRKDTKAAKNVDNP